MPHPDISRSWRPEGHVIIQTNRPPGHQRPCHHPDTQVSGRKIFVLLWPKCQIGIGSGTKQCLWEQNLTKKARIDEHLDSKGSKMGQNHPDTNLRILAKSHLTYILSPNHLFTFQFLSSIIAQFLPFLFSKLPCDPFNALYKHFPFYSQGKLMWCLKYMVLGRKLQSNHPG